MSDQALRLPDFIVGGAARSGTTWLYEVADAHPEIAMAKPPRPEPKFFFVDPLYERGLAYYAETWFAPLPRGSRLGEKSTAYLESPDAARRIRAALPDVRMVFLLRHPADRAYSNYVWSRQNGHETEEFERALALEEERERTAPPEQRFVRPFAYFSRGLYASHLARYFAVFPRERILILRYEDIAARPREVALEFQRFLGIAERPDLVAGRGPVNASNHDAVGPMPRDVREALTRRYAAENRRLCELLGPGFALWDDAAAR